MPLPTPNQNDDKTRESRPTGIKDWLDQAAEALPPPEELPDEKELADALTNPKPERPGQDG
jgi:hypothetical protein